MRFPRCVVSCPAVNRLRPEAVVVSGAAPSTGSFCCSPSMLLGVDDVVVDDVVCVQEAERQRVAAALAAQREAEAATAVMTI